MIIVKIYFDSNTGNVLRFINKLKEKFFKMNLDIEIIKIDEFTIIDSKCHFITYTTGIGNVSKKTKSFLLNNYKLGNTNKILSVSSSGNMNWGDKYGLAADKISRKFYIPILMKFELSGTDLDVEKYINKILEWGIDETK